MRHRLAVPIFLVLTGLALAACQPDAPSTNNAASTAVEEIAADPQPAIKGPEPPLTRARLLAAAARAAAAYAAGRPQPPEDAGLVGRRFSISIPFGCPGAGEGDKAGASWSYDTEAQRLQLSREPDISAETPVVEAIDGEFEAVEGFWIPREWTDSEACPQASAPGPAAQSMQTPPSVGVAQFFTTADSRLIQRAGRAYETVERLDPGQLPGAQGFRLVLAGRIAALPSGRTIVCHSSHPNVRPACVIAVEIDRASFMNPASGESLATWEAR